MTETINFETTDTEIPILMTYERLMAFGPRPSIDIWLNLFAGVILTGTSKESLPITSIEAENGLAIKFVVDNSTGNSGKIILRR